MIPRLTIQAFDRFLASRQLRWEAVAIGGSALALLGLIDRPTRDLDVLEPPLPEELVLAGRDFALTLRESGEHLADDWLNNGPASLADVLPTGWRSRLQSLFEGESLLLLTLGRQDLIKSKLFALCDRGTDLADCLALRPSREEVEEALPWVAEQDAHHGWPAHVETTLMDLARRLGHGV